MESERTADGGLILKYESRTTSRLLLLIALVLAALIGYELVTGRRFGDGVGGAVAGLVTVAICALLTCEVSWFLVDPRTATISYRRQWAFRRLRGTVSFADVERVLAESSIGNRSVARRRVVFHLRDGTAVPLTAAYMPDRGEAIAIAGQIGALLGHRPLPTAIDRARVFARAGRTTDAVRELRQGTNVSLDDAVRQVRELAKEPLD
jgi:hypothetical protein